MWRRGRGGGGAVGQVGSSVQIGARENRDKENKNRRRHLKFAVI